ncbi:BLIP family beta-lactamase inhibitor [Streptomyces sp. NPDC018610]|uniref:BLIP family beta-lactamase inhibitor n=1 Tax=Streptomyces sp. NPDC018610 TaxID=3365049 RepID=UPI00379B895D
MMHARSLTSLSTLAALVTGLALSAAAPSTAAPVRDSYLTQAAYDAVTAGMTAQQVKNVVGPNPHCYDTSAGLECWTPNQQVDMYATFSFNGDGLLYRKEKNGAFAYAAYTRDKPGATMSQYDSVTQGEQLSAVNAVLAGAACTDMWVEYPAYPSSAGWQTLVQCTGTAAEANPTFVYAFTDGRLTQKSYTLR